MEESKDIGKREKKNWEGNQSGTEPDRTGRSEEGRRKDRLKKAEAIAREIWILSRDSIVVNMRFMDTALARLRPVPREGIGCAASDGTHIYYDSLYLLKQYQKEPSTVVRMYLHILLHHVFYHNYQYGRLEQEYWDLASDIAVENTIMELELPAASLEDDKERKDVLEVLKKQVKVLTADKIYKYLKINGLSQDARREWTRLFKQDEHVYWKEQEEIVISQKEWDKISQRIKADLKTFSRDKTNAESLKANLEDATKERYNYADILSRFTVMGEELTVNDDEFDYIYYTYGLDTYGNIPLIEPLEYKDVKRIKEFAIVIDTSASCKGTVVQAFLQKTYEILKGRENFFQKINVHLIQCDNQVHSDTKITCQEDFEAFMKNGRLTGFGGTDFRPAFSYVDTLLEEGEFENFKGLIYFTDGYGIYPERMPSYDSMFVFLQEDERIPSVPPWAIKVVLDEEDLEENRQEAKEEDRREDEEQDWQEAKEQDV